MSGPQGAAFGSTITKQDESINITSSYSNVFNFDIGNYSDGVIVMRSNANTNYKIYASAKFSQTIPADNDDSWVNTLDISTTAADYNHDTSKLLNANTTFYESISNKWRWFRIDMQTASTAVAKIWFRGRNTR